MKWLTWKLIGIVSEEIMEACMKASPLGAHLGYWLRFVSNHVSGAFAARLAERGTTVAEWVALRLLLDGAAMAPSELAARMGMSRGGITKLVDRLIAKDLIARRAGEEDRRYQALELTRAGRALVPVLAQLADRNDAEFFGHLTPAERAQIEAALQEIVRRQAWDAHPVE